MLVRDVSQAKAAIQAAGIPDDQVDFIKGDVTDIESLKKAFSEKDVGHVISSIGGLRATQIDGQGNVNLIDAAKDAGVDNFILVSSTSVTRTWSFLNLLGLAKPKLRGSFIRAENRIFLRSNVILPE
jgi:nucleoside-diphosphate-sugar epimerase